MSPRYPIFIPSKGRYTADRALTAKTFARWGVPFRLVVEEQEADGYRKLLAELDLDPEPHVLVLPFRDMGTSQPARAWIHERAVEEGYARHWNIDDNISEFRRLWKGRRIPCHAGVALCVCEDLSDRFENVAVSGLNYQMFVRPDIPVPFYVNCHIYSCTLICHAAPVRWRLRYNEDTDLCLQALATREWCTIALNAFMANKMRTMVLGGGNTASLYDAGDGGARDTATRGRLRMAKTLEDHWPGFVKTRWRFGRPQHSVNWGAFKTPLRLRPDVDLASLPACDEYGLRLRAVKEVRSEALRALLAEANQQRILSS